MVTHMKTTVDIADELLARAKSLARRENTSLRSVIEDGLRWVLSQRRQRQRFRLRDASVDGKGLQDGVSEGSWDRVRDLLYEGRGS